MTTTNSSSLPLAARLLVAGRGAAGLGGWLAPNVTWRAAGLGAMPDHGSTAVVTRLFGVRDLALAIGVAQPHAEVRRAALLTGLALDSLDAVSGAIGVRGGAPKSALVGVSAGALLLVGLGVVALRELDAR